MGRRLSCVLALLACTACQPALARTQPDRAAGKPGARTPARPGVPEMAVVPWSLEPQMGQTESRLGLRAEKQDSDPPTGTEQIIVFGKKRAPIESELIRHDAPGAEAWQSEAAQPYTAGIGDGCSYKNGCFDKSQPGLFSTIPSLFGDR